MFKSLKNHCHSNQKGNIMLLGLAVLGFLVVPLTGILFYASQAGNASVTARGIAFSTSYAGLSRAIDGPATLDAQQPQLYRIGSPGIAAAETQVQQAAVNAWVYNGVGRSLPGSSLSMASLSSPGEPRWGGYSYYSASSNPGVLGVVNVSSSPANAFKASGQSCEIAGGFKNDSAGGTACWVDNRIKELYGAADRDPGKVPAGISRDSWDHYSSGVEVDLRLKLPGLGGLIPGSTSSDTTSRFRSASSFAQPCLVDLGGTGDCAQ